MDNRRQPLAIYGVSGTGKSALMAKAVHNLRDQAKDCSTQRAVIIERFIGATPESTNIRLLLEGICKIINRAYAQEEFEVPEDFNELVQAFEDRLALAASEKPLIIFLDALDQLSQAESAHNLNWLPSELPPNVKIVVSTLPEPYPCLNTLKAKLSPENVRDLKLLSPQHGEEVMEVWLRTAGRTLQEEQRQEVLGKFSRCGLPLYLKLAFEEAKRWHSYDDVPEYEGRPGLAKDLPSIIGNLFWRLSLPVNHGNLLVERSLGYLAAAKNGLTEDEMLDVLSYDKEFYTQFRGQIFHELTEERLPVIIWSRLYFDLALYLTERTADGTSLFSFYHRQLGEVSKETFLSGEREQHSHRDLAQYFVNQEHWIESGDKKIPNFRKLSELPFQQTQGEMWNDIETTLTDLFFIEAKCAAGMTYELIVDYNAVLDSLPEAQKEKREEEERFRKYTEDLIAYSRGEIPSLDIIPSVEPWSGEKIKKAIERIKNNPSRLDRIREFSQFIKTESQDFVNFGSIPGFCFQQAFNHASSGPVAEKSSWILKPENQLPVFIKNNNSRPEFNPFPGCTGTIRGHAWEVHAVSLTPDGHIAVSGGQDGMLKIWDIHAGQCLRTLKGHTDDIYSVAITPDGHTVISGGEDNMLRVWDVDTGQCLRIIQGYTSIINAISLTPDGHLAVSAGDFEDKTLQVWDVLSGNCLRILKGHTDSASTVSITSDGHLVVSGSKDNSVRMWDVL